MAAIDVDMSRFPLVVVTFHGTPTQTEFETYLDTLSANLQRGQPNAVVLDARDSGNAPAWQRRRQAEWIRDHSDELRRWSRGTAFVFSSAVTRFILSTILLIEPMPMPTPYAVVATLEEGTAWARARLHGENA